MTAGAAKAPPRSGGSAGYWAGDIPRDVLAGLTLAAVAIPEQMATARLGGFPPQFGFFAFIAATLAFSLIGSNRLVSVGANSTITPIFAGALATLAAAGSPHAFALAAALALMVGAIVMLAGLARMGWIADLLSAPVTMGFLAGIAVHIIASQLPAAVGVPGAAGGVIHRLAALARESRNFSPYAMAIAAGVLGLTAALHRLSARLPGALIAIALASVAVVFWRLDERGLAVLGTVQGGLPVLTAPILDVRTWLQLAPLALLVALVVMVQTAATSRAFPPDPDRSPDLNRDFIAVGTSNLFAGIAGAFPVNASPPRTAVVAESGGRSKLAGLAAVAVVVVVLAVGTTLLARIPQAALAGILLFIALRIVRVGQIAQVARTSLAELLLVIATAAAIIALPIASGVAVGIVLSLLHGMWSSARPRTFTLERLTGTTVWWPKTGEAVGETLAGVAVLGFQGPLSFLNAYAFQRQIAEALSNGPKLIVLEAAGIIDIDFTAAQVFKDVIRLCHEAGTIFALARLQAADAEDALARFGLRQLIGEDHVFPSVAEAIAALAPAAPVAG